MVLRPEYVSGIDAKVESRAHGLRKLLAEKVPVRLSKNKYCLMVVL